MKKRPTADLTLGVRSRRFLADPGDNGVIPLAPDRLPASPTTQMSSSRISRFTEAGIFRYVWGYG